MAIRFLLQILINWDSHILMTWCQVSGNIDISLVPSCSLYIRTKAGIQMKLVSLYSDLVRTKTRVSSPGLRRTTQNEVGKIFITHFFNFFFYQKIHDIFYIMYWFGKRKYLRNIFKNYCRFREMYITLPDFW